MDHSAQTLAWRVYLIKIILLYQTCSCNGRVAIVQHILSLQPQNPVALGCFFSLCKLINGPKLAKRNQLAVGVGVEKHNVRCTNPLHYVYPRFYKRMIYILRIGLATTSLYIGYECFFS